MEPAERVLQMFNASIALKHQALATLPEPIAIAANHIVASLLEGGKLLCCGNGGSAGSAQLLSAKMLNGFERERPGLPAISLTTDSSILTAIANDYGYDQVFARQINAIGHPGDLLVVMTTSGNSANLTRAVEAAHERQMRVIALTGRDGGVLTDLIDENDIEIRVPADTPARTQEVHLLIIHCLCDLVDQQLLGG